MLKKTMSNYWLFPCNPKLFYVHECFLENTIVDWKQGKYNVNVGDFVFIYCSRGERKIRYFCKVIKVDIPLEESNLNPKYWGENHVVIDRYCRLQLLVSIDTDELSLGALYSNGLTARIQGKQRVTPQLLEYIESVFNK